MQIFMVIIGFCALMLAWGFMFKTGLIFKVNAWVKEHILNDQVMLYSRRRVALLMFVLGLLALFSGLNPPQKTPSIPSEASKQLLEEAKKELRARRFQRAINIGKVLTKADSFDVAAWEVLAKSYWSTGQKEEVLRCLRVISALESDNETVKSLTQKLKFSSNVSPKK